ncbi:MAG: glycoside hydrolase family 3 protein, partial [Candidatus Thermoplasmatota archaeon]|nr:glycoside hydrolase family 3 protein [Candidatus Thermoplasmatota archaeon]
MNRKFMIVMATVAVFLMIGADFSICASSIEAKDALQTDNALGVLSELPTEPAAGDTPIYKDPNAPIEARVEDLLSRMTLEEKMEQMRGTFSGDGYYTNDNTNLGIPGFKFADGPEGVKRCGNATLFPVSMVRGSTWDPELEQMVGEAIGRETRAKGENCMLAPCINIIRNPLWGRSKETYSEDSYLIGEMGAAFVVGVQSQKAMACAKHFAVNNIENTAKINNAVIDERTLREIYLPHFKACVDAGVASVMSAYNRVNGVYCSANYHLLREILKEEWGFDGFVVSDWSATTPTMLFMAEEHVLPADFFSNLTALPGQPTDREVLDAGLDVEMPYPALYGPLLEIDANAGLVPVEKINDAVRRILRHKFEFGLFDNPSPFNESVVECEEHISTARRAEREGAVLLKNDNNALPLDAGSLKSIAVIGPILPPYTESRSSYMVSPLQGIKNRVGNSITVCYSDGSNADEAAETAKKSDVAIVFAGFTSENEGENTDRANLALPEGQPDLINKVASA